MSPSETALMTQVLISAGFLFGIAYLGNRLSFSNRFVNALITALIFAVFYAGLAYTVDQTVLPPEMKEATVKIVATDDLDGGGARVRS